MHFVLLLDLIEDDLRAGLNELAGVDDLVKDDVCAGKVKDDVELADAAKVLIEDDDWV